MRPIGRLSSEMEKSIRRRQLNKHRRKLQACNGAGFGARSLAAHAGGTCVAEQPTEAAILAVHIPSSMDAAEQQVISYRSENAGAEGGHMSLVMADRAPNRYPPLERTL